MKKFYLNVNGETAGPYSLSDLRTMKIKPSTPVWFTGAVNWKSADSIPELKVLFNSDPFEVSDRTKQFNRPRSRSTSFQQFNFEPEKPETNPKRIAIIVGLVIVLVACGAGFYLQKQRERVNENAEQIQMYLDSLNQNQGQESVTDVQEETEAPPVVEEAAPESMYTGVYDNLKGAIITVSGSGKDLKIDLKYDLASGDNCKGEITGSGSPVSDSLVAMTTDDGCKLELKFRSRYTVVLKESGTCNSYHGKHCLFNGNYYGQ
jgi:hypothetical protein